MTSNTPIKSRSRNEESVLFNQRPTHKLSRSSSLSSSAHPHSQSNSQSRPHSPIKLTSTPLIIHRNQKPSRRPINQNQHQHQSIFQSNQIDSLKPIKEINLTNPTLKSNHPQPKENISVCIRLRPLPDSSLSDIDLDPPPSNQFQSSSSSSSNQFGPWSINPTLSQLSLSSSHPIIDKRGTGTSESINGSEGYEFTLDSIYNPYSTTHDLYEGNVKKVIQSCVREGYNVTVFAYGQTGSGKTFTMMGSSLNPAAEEEEEEDHQEKGIIPKSIDEVFKVITQEDQTREYLLRVSYLEIYNETLKDLLSDHGSTPQKLTIHENLKGRVYVNGLREEVVTHPLQVINTLQKGEKSRHVGATDWNERSSRSHTVFTMTIESRPKDPEELNQTGMQISQLNLIDLAGSESAASSIERRKEGSFINKSLLSLSNVISKLAKSEPHVPYRDSKLTRLLSTSLGGNAKVVVICTVSVNNDSVAETLSTLRFARRAKMVVTKAERGTILDDTSALLQSYQQEIMSLKAQLLNNSQALSLSNLGSSHNDHDDSLIEVEKSKVKTDVAELQLERIRLQEQIEHLNRRILTRHTIQSNVRRSSLSISQVNPILEQESSSSNLVRRQRRGRLTDFGGLVSHGGNLGGGIFNVGLRASLLPNMLSVSKEIELEKQISKLKIENEEKETQLKVFKERELEGTNLNSNQDDGLRDELEKLKKEIQRVENEKINSVKALEDEIKFKHEEIQKSQVELVSKTEESQTQLVIESEVENLRTELLNAQTTILELKETREKQSNFEKELKEIEIKLNRVEKKYSNERNKAQEIQFELMQITQSRDELENELKERLAESKGFEKELVEVKELLEQEKQRKEEIELMKHENNTLKDEVDSLKALVEGKDKTLMEEKIKLEEEVKNLKQLNEEREKIGLEEKNRLEKELIELKDLLGEKEMGMSKEKEQVYSDLVEIRKTVEEKDREKKVLEVEIEQLRETVLKQENGMVEERKELEEEGEQMRRLMKEKEEKVKLEKEKFEKELQELQELMNKKESERRQLEDQVKELKGLAVGQSSAVVEEKHRLDKEITELKHLLEESMSEKTKLKEQLEQTESYRSKSEDLSSKLSASELKLRKTQDEVKVIEEMVTKLKKENEEVNRTGRLQNREVERLGKELSEVEQMKEEIQTKLEAKSLQTQTELVNVHQNEIQKLELQQSNLFNQIITLEKEIKQEKEKKSDLGSIESKKKIKELERMIKEQQQENEELVRELQRSQVSNKSNRHGNAHHQAEDEIERLNLIIEEQKKMLSDAKSDMAKWQGHLKAQQAIISKIQGNHHTNPEHLIANLPRSSSSMSSTMNRTVSKSSAPPMSTSHSYQNTTPTTTTPLLGSSMSYSNHSRNSPKPLPVPDSFEDHDEEWRRRKNRRKTIEEDMAKLRDENVVERKRNVLMSSSPRNPSSNKPKRNLSGLSSRANRLNNLNSLDSSIHLDHHIPPLPTSKSLNDRFKK